MHPAKRRRTGEYPKFGRGCWAKKARSLNRNDFFNGLLAGLIDMVRYEWRPLQVMHVDDRDRLAILGPIQGVFIERIVFCSPPARVSVRQAAGFERVTRWGDPVRVEVQLWYTDSGRPYHFGDGRAIPYRESLWSSSGDPRSGGTFIDASGKRRINLPWIGETPPAPWIELGMSFEDWWSAVGE